MKKILLLSLLTFAVISCEKPQTEGVNEPLVNQEINQEPAPATSSKTEAETKKLRVGVIGDSISTFKDIIPAGHAYYYPNGDVTEWTHTYWALLINEYWDAELDMNCSYSGGCVTPRTGIDPTTDYVTRCEYFTDPDIILLHGGTNDRIQKVGLGALDFTSPLESLDMVGRFREAYIAVIRKMQAKYPDALIICIIGTWVEDDYGHSVKAIAEYFDLPYVDFRGDKEVTAVSGSHPDKAGMAHMAQKIYQTTKDVVNAIR